MNLARRFSGKLKLMVVGLAAFPTTRINGFADFPANPDLSLRRPTIQTPPDSNSVAPLLKRLTSSNGILTVCPSATPANGGADLRID